MNPKENPIPSISQVEKKYSLPEKKDYFSFRRSEQFVLDEMEKDYTILSGSARNKLKEQLREKYCFLGFEQEDTENYLKALSNQDKKTCQKIYLKTGARFEEAGRLVIAAEYYYEAGQYQKAAETLIKEGHQGFGNSPLFLWAADCLIHSGIPQQEAYLTVSQEIKKFINRKENKKEYFDSENAYYNLGECLHRADQKKEALKTFMKAGREKDDQLTLGKKYSVRIEDWKKAAKFQKILIKTRFPHNSEDAFELAEYYHKAGLKKEEAKALWSEKYFLEGAKIAFEITQNKKYFLQAAEAYNKIRPRRQAYFVNNIREYFSEGCNKICFNSSIKGNNKEKLNRFHELLINVFSAYSLPLPQKVAFEPEKSIKDHKEIFIRINHEFQEKKKTVKKNETKNVLLDSDLAGAIEHGVLGGISLWNIKDHVREAFKGISCPRPLESNLTLEMQELWEKAGKEEVNSIGCDPIEMAGRAYEEGGYYKEAKERYLKINLLDDVKRMEAKVKLEEL